MSSKSKLSGSRMGLLLPPSLFMENVYCTALASGAEGRPSQRSLTRCIRSMISPSFFRSPSSPLE